MISPEKTRLLYDFLNKWPLEKIKSITYEEYTNLEDKTTFCYSVEHGTAELGTIRGFPSSKFGFFKWGANFNKNSTSSSYDSKYAWPKKFGATRKVAFKRVIQNICEVIESAQIYDLEAIENNELNAWYKWKLASLYSEGLIPPIFKQQVIENIAQEYEIPTSKGEKAPVLAYIMNGIPENECRFEFVFELFREFDNDNYTAEASNKKNESSQKRFRKKASYTAENRHNIIQNSYYKQLCKKYPNDYIKLEKNYVDIFRENDDQVYFYEVKSNASPTYCVREALGQVLHYAYKHISSKEKKIVVVGERSALDGDKSYFEYLKKHITVDFEYIDVPITI